MSSQTPKVSYQKPWQSYADQVSRLVARGLAVPNLSAAEQFLSHVNYYRFSGYCLAFEQPRHLFSPGVTFDDVANAYRFDTTLRDLLTEVISFGTLTRMLRSMKRTDQQSIAARYGLQAKCFETILLHLVYVRNLCAHHSRLWDRVWSIKPTLPHGKMWSAPLMPGNDRLFSTLCLIQHLLRKCSVIGPFATDWKNRLHSLLQSPPNTARALRTMGLTIDWDQHPIWSFPPDNRWSSNEPLR